MILLHTLNFVLKCILEFLQKPRDYHFEYAVSDPHTGDHKSQWEVKKDGVVRGAYSLLEPDGTTRIVEYIADDLHGFRAVVKKIGEPINGHGYQNQLIYDEPTPLSYNGQKENYAHAIPYTLNAIELPEPEQKLIPVAIQPAPKVVPVAVHSVPVLPKQEVHQVAYVQPEVRIVEPTINVAKGNVPYAYGQSRHIQAVPYYVEPNIQQHYQVPVESYQQIQETHQPIPETHQAIPESYQPNVYVKSEAYQPNIYVKDGVYGGGYGGVQQQGKIFEAVPQHVVRVVKPAAYEASNPNYYQNIPPYGIPINQNLYKAQGDVNNVAYGLEAYESSQQPVVVPYKNIQNYMKPLQKLYNLLLKGVKQ